MAEATALRRRVELQVLGEAESVIAGFRDEGRVSIYFGPDPVYHFDEHGRLRRAFVAGKLYRTGGTTLARLTRERTDETTTLVRHDLSEAELQDFLSAMQSRLQTLQEMIETQQITIVRQVPADSPILPEFSTALSTIWDTKIPLAEPIKAKP
ncbi:MAG: hypothetical protein IID46_01115 [Planctomycetes bacterium]|nr:hypothetical protein [Planctomycetota bacterium]